MARISLLFILTIGLMSNLFAQNRYIVHLKDKIGSPFSIDNPSEFLSQKAIDRREAQNIQITEDDLPVNPSYIDDLKALDIEVFYQSKWFNAVLVQMQASKRSEVENLSFVDDVELVAPGTRLKKGSRSGRSEGSEVTLNFVQNQLLGVATLHEAGYYGEDQLIAVLDGGYSGVMNQPAFAELTSSGRIKHQFNFIENDNNVFQYGDHGTRALSTMAANLEGEYEGIATSAGYLLYISEEERDANGSFTEYRIEEYNMLFALEMADSAGADIISTSLGYYTFDNPAMDYTYEDMDGNTTVVTRACEKAFSKGMFIVTSAGNQGNKTWQYITAPADGPHVMSVGAVNEEGERVSFSSLGPNFNGDIKPDIMALGSAASLIDDGGSTTSSGTSFSAPQIAGLAALLWERQPDLTNQELFNLILSLGDRFNNPDNEYGYGIPNAAKLITSVNNELNEFNMWPNPFNSLININVLKPIREIFLYNSNSQQIDISVDLQQEIVKVYTQQLPAGLYMLKLVSTDGEVYTRKLIKQID